MAGTAHAGLLAYWNFGDSIAQDAVVPAPYGPTVVASGVSVTSMQFESGWLVITDQVNRQLGSTSLTIGSQTFNSDSILELTSLVLQAARNNAQPARSFDTIALYVDSGSGQFLVGTRGPTPIAGTLAPVTFDLTSLGLLSDGSSVTFRLYGDNGVNGDNAFGRELFIDDITVNGFTSPIPEPAGLWAVCVLGMGLLVRRRGTGSL